MENLPYRKGIMALISSSSKNILLRKSEGKWTLPFQKIKGIEDEMEVFYSILSGQLGLGKSDVMQPYLTNYYYEYDDPNLVSQGWPYKGERWRIITARILEDDKPIQNGMQRFASLKEAALLLESQKITEIIGKMNERGIL